MIVFRNAAAFALLVSVGQLAAEEQPPTDEEIAAAVQQLGAGDFAARSQATDFLWKAGRVAEPALRAALQSGDPEVAYRARQVLDKFQYGIYPDTPPAVLELIRQYRSGNDSEKRTVLRRLQEMDEFRTLMALLRVEPNESLRRQIAGGFLANAQEVVPELLARGESQQVEQMLELAATTNAGMRHYSAYFAVQGQLDEKIRELEERLAGQFGDVKSHVDAHLRVYLWRAKGDFAQARNAVESVVANQSIVKAALFEARDWTELSKTHQAFFPFAQGREDLETLGFAAAFYRLSGDRDGYQKTIDRIKAKAALDPSEVWYCAEALLINDQPDAAINLFKQHRPLSAFQLLAAQERYVEAFDVLGLPTPGSDFNPWIDQLLADVTGADKEKHDRFYIGVEAAEALHRLGETDTAKQLFTRLAAAVNNDGGDHRRLRAVCEAQVKLGMWQQAAQQLAPVFADRMDNFALRALFADHTSIAQIWLLYFRGKLPDEPPAELVAKIRALLRLDGQPLENFDQIIADAKAAADRLGENHVRTWYPAFAKTCLQNDRRDLAMPLFQAVAEVSDGASMMQLADLFAEDQEWEAAAKWYRKAWEQDQQVAALYLAGRALSKAGKEAAGADMMKRANLSPLADEKIRQQFAEELKERGLVEEAEGQWQLIMRTGEFHSWHVNNAAQNLGNAASGHDDLFAADCWERLALSVLRTSSAFVETEGYLTLPHLVHKARAVGLFRAGEIDKAVEETWISYTAKPGNSKFVEDMIPELERAGRSDDADKLFDKAYTLLTGVCKTFPNSAMHHNNLAWMSARCDRRLNEALTHAQRAVELQPDNAGYIDTLAEAHFRLGQIDEAIAHAKRCLEISPGNSFFQKQLERFQGEHQPP